MKRIFLFIFTALICSQIQAISPRQAKRWVQSRKWSQGWTVNPDRSVNAQEFAEQYAKNPEVWQAAFNFLATNNLDSLPTGNYQIIEGRCRASVSEYVPCIESDGGIEEHRRFIDLQYTLSGKEKMGIATDCSVQKPYDEKADIGFHTSKHIKYYPAAADRFFLFFPSDRHQPSVRDKNSPEVKSRKVVLKIEYVK